MPGLISTQLCGTTSGLAKVSRIGSPAFTVKAGVANQSGDAATLTLAGIDVVPVPDLTHALGTGLVAAVAAA